jgi:hypothetical protein
MQVITSCGAYIVLQIVIGDWARQRSVILASNQPTGIIGGSEWVPTWKQTLDPHEDRPFWISWANDVISVGRVCMCRGRAKFSDTAASEFRSSTSMSVLPAHDVRIAGLQGAVVGGDELMRAPDVHGIAGRIALVAFSAFYAPSDITFTHLGM